MFTTLTKEALPLIRYRTRDLTALLPPTARSMRRMARISGRSDDMLIIRGVNLFPTQIEELLLKLPGLAPHFQLEVTRAGHLDELGVCVECSPAVATDAALRGRLGQELADEHQGHASASPPRWWSVTRARSSVPPARRSA